MIKTCLSIQIFGVIFMLAMTLPWNGGVHAQTMTELGTYEWSSETINGLSGLEVFEDGTTFATVSDQGWYVAGTFQRQDDQIVGINVTEFLPILGNDGLPVAARRVGDWSDAEGLAIAANGTHWISFERWAHVSRFDGPESTGQWIKDHPSFNDFDDNRQLEALAVHPDGTVYVFPEQTLGSGFPIFRLNDNDWEISGEIAKLDGFAIVGADFDTDGQLYLLERKLVLGLWWQSRIRRLDVNAPGGIEILWTSARGAFRNLEGIAVWRDEIGLRLTLVSDNNRDRAEVTQFVEFRLSE